MGEITIFWGTLLRQLREKHKLNQADIAGILHISRASYSNIETGRKKPSTERTAKINKKARPSDSGSRRHSLSFYNPDDIE